MTAFSETNTKRAIDGTLGADLTHTSDEAGFALGTTVKGNDGTEWVYVQASGAITQYDCVAIDESFQAAAMTKALADAGHQVGFAQVAFADNDYGWVAIRGADIGCRLKTACAADVALYTTASAGMLDDTSASQTLINGAVAVAVSSSSGEAVEIIARWPWSSVSL